MTTDALGKGLAALVGDNKIKSAQSTQTKLLPVHLLRPNSLQPRKNFDETLLAELINSIKQNGILQPLIIRKTHNDIFEIIAGERRWRAALKANLQNVPVIIIEADDKKAMEIALVENIQRKDLNIIEEANGYKNLIEKFNYTQEKISLKVGKSRSHIANLLRILTLPQKILSLLNEKKISPGHARCLINTTQPLQMAQKIIEENLSVRETENLTKTTTTHTINKKNIKYKHENFASQEHNLQKILGIKTKITTKKMILYYNDINDLYKILALLQKNHLTEKDN